MSATGDICVRPLRSDDADAVYELRRQPEVQKFTLALPSERQTDYVAKLGPNDHVFVAEIAGRVVGIAGLHVKDGKARHSAWLGVAVHDAFGGRGVARALMDKLLDVADNWLNLVRVELEVFADNPRARTLYQRFDFAEEGLKRKDAFRGGAFVDTVMMARVR